LAQRLALVVGTSREQALATAHNAVRKVVTIFMSHYPQMDRAALSSRWAPDYKDRECDEIEAGSVDFINVVTTCALLMVVIHSFYTRQHVLFGMRNSHQH
jgi:hypothetical protein